MKNKTMLFIAAALLAVGLVPRYADAVDFKHLEDVGIESMWSVCVSSNAAGGKLCGGGASSQSSIGISSWTIPGWLTQYQIQTVGGAAQFNIAVSTDNQVLGDYGPTNSGAYVPSYWTSSTTWVTATTPLLIQTYGQAFNTILTLSSLDSGASVYMRLNYLAPRGKGQQ